MQPRTAAQLDAATPEPGIYAGVPFPQYRAIKALNAGKLLWGRLSMFHLHEALEDRLEGEDTPALAFGRALHLRLLEPDLFAALVKPKSAFGSMKSPTNKAAAEAWEAANPQGILLTDDELERVEGAAAGLRINRADSLRRCRGLFEVTLIAEVAGLLCKARFDKLIAEPPTIIDVKKTRVGSASDTDSLRRRFSNDLAYYGYAFKAAFYCDVAKALLGREHRFVWLVVEDSPPHAVATYSASDCALDSGRAEYGSLIHRMKECQQTGAWPGYTSDIEPIEPPAWYLKGWGV